MNCIKLSREQISMLNMSEDDIKHGRVLSQEDLEKQDLEWMKKCTFKYSIENKK